MLTLIEFEYQNRNEVYEIHHLSHSFRVSSNNPPRYVGTWKTLPEIREFITEYLNGTILTELTGE